MNRTETRSEMPAVQAGSADDSPKEPADASNRDRPCWLVVDDDVGILKYFAPLLTVIAGVETRCFTSPVKALEAFTEAPRRFQCVVTDLDMPRMSGIELCQKLRQISPDVKVLLFTGTGLVTREEVLAQGFCELLNKPFSLKSLKKTLGNADLLNTASPLSLKTTPTQTTKPTQ